MPPKRRLPMHQKDAAQEIAETPAPEPASSSPTAPPAQRAKIEEEGPEWLKRAPGNVRWVEGDLNGNIAGIASIAFAAVTMLEKLNAGNADRADINDIRAALKYMGGAKVVDEFSRKIHEQVGFFKPKPQPETSAFSKLFDDMAWQANPLDNDDDDAEAGEAGGRQASIELGMTPAPMEKTTTTAAGREREGSEELGAATGEAATGPVVIPSDPESSSLSSLSSNVSPLAQKSARAAEKSVVTSKYFGPGAGAGGASGKA